MDGPERLEIGTSRGGHRTVAVVALAVTLVLGLGAVRLAALGDRTAPAPGPTPAAAPTPGAGGWPQTPGSGTLYVLDANGVGTVDVASGLLQRADVDLDPADMTMTAAGLGVLVSSADHLRRAQLVAYGSDHGFDVDRRFRAARQLLPGPGSSVWVSPTEPSGTSGESVWSLSDVEDPDARAVATARLRGDVIGDGSGGLFGTDEGRVRHVRGRTSELLGHAAVRAVGPDGYVLLRCTGGSCRTELHDRASGRDAVLPAPIADALDLAALSPGNGFVASTAPGSGAAGSGTVVRVAVPGGSVRRSFPGGSGGTALTWLSSRWLVASTDTGLTLYDVVDDRLHLDALPLAEPTELVFLPA